MIHPEQCRDEFLIANSTEEAYHSIGWKTKRRGMHAYDMNGLVIPKINRLFPVFIKQEEVRITDPKLYESLLKEQYETEAEFLDKL